MIRHIIFKVVGKCNLDCPYCYYMTDLDSKWSKRFDPSNFDSLFSNISKYTDNLRISWHGGEPLLVGIDFFDEALSQAKIHGVKLRNSIQTNGILVDQEWCDFFKENDFHVGVSIDGPELLHNRERPTKSKTGKSSYQGAFDAINLLNANKVKTGTLTVVHPGEDGGLIFDHLLSLGIKSMDFLLPITASPTNQEHLEGCAKYLLDAFERWTQLGDSKVKVRYFENIMKSVMGAPPKQCILTNRCSPYITVEPNGDVGMCENIRMVNSDFYETGLNILSSSLYEIESAVDSKLATSGFNTLGAECSKCDYVKACQGGCPVARYDGALGFQQPSSYCELYKTIIFHVYNYVNAQMPRSGNSSLAIEVT